VNESPAAQIVRHPPRVDLKPWFFTLEDIPARTIGWRDLFGNENPVEVEIGSGRGLFLLNSALARPETNFLGIEYDFKEGRRAATRLKKRSLPNARLLGADARLVLSKYLADGSAAAAHIYFPDPWWKRRHKKRRIFSSDFIKQVARILAPAGILHAWTDVAEYFEVMQQVVAGIAEFRPLPPPQERSAVHDMDYHTSFERKKRKLGLPIYRARWERM
jgi:tRNA (guanine-N7-)-methyltransferase